MKFKSIAFAAALVCGGAIAVEVAPPSNPLALDVKAVQEAGIAIETATERTLSQELKAPGEVKADAYSTVLVSPRVEAQVITRKAKLGDVVKAGQPLVTLSSVQVAETQGALIVAEQDWQRVAALGPQAVSARHYTEAKVARDQAHAKLHAFGLSDAQVQVLLRAGSTHADGCFDLLAPIAGRIATDEFLIGERVEPGRNLFTLVKDDKVWVEAQLSLSDAARAKVGQSARIVARDLTLVGRVLLSSTQTNERTRTVPVRIEVENRDNTLRPGELVEAYVAIGESASVLAIPAESIVLLQNQAVVFVPAQDSTFASRPIATGDTRDGWTVVKQGLKPGDRYVSKGAFALKARLLRSQLGED
jgi:cobalt-zinc-cadmium efflux system membrane fusion protein